MPKEKHPVYVVAKPSKIDEVLWNFELTKKERSELFQEFLEDEKYKIKPRAKHPKKREENI